MAGDPAPGAQASLARGGARQRKRSAQDASPELVLNYTAARAFLLGEWFGATLMVASFTLLYLLAFGAHASPTVTYATCLALLAVGTLAYLRSRTYYQRIGFDYAPRWHVGALVVAGSAGIFWLLFAVLTTLAWFGVPIQ